MNLKFNVIFVRLTNLEIPSPNFADPMSPILLELWNILKIMIGKKNDFVFRKIIL